MEGVILGASPTLGPGRVDARGRASESSRRALGVLASGLLDVCKRSRRVNVVGEE